MTKVVKGSLHLQTIRAASVLIGRYTTPNIVDRMTAFMPCLRIRYLMGVPANAHTVLRQ